MVTLWVITALSAVLFLIAFRVVKVVPAARRALHTMQGASATMQSKDIDDLEREKAVQRAAISLLGSAASIIGRSLVAIAAALVPVVIAHAIGLSPFAATLDFMERWDVILILTLVILAGYVGSLKLWPR